MLYPGTSNNGKLLPLPGLKEKREEVVLTELMGALRRECLARAPELSQGGDREGTP